MNKNTEILIKVLAYVITYIILGFLLDKFILGIYTDFPPTLSLEGFALFAIVVIMLEFLINLTKKRKV